MLPLPRGTPRIPTEPSGTAEVRISNNLRRLTAKYPSPLRFAIADTQVRFLCAVERKGQELPALQRLAESILVHLDLAVPRSATTAFTHQPPHHQATSYARFVTANVERLLDTLLQLPQEDRAAVAAVLTDSLEQGPPEEIEAAWIEEAKQRLERIRSNQATPVPSAVVEQELDEIVARATTTTRAAG